MADISQSNWTEADASNNTAAPDGMPEGMAPSGVNDWGRAAAGAIKRWYNQMIPLVTGGTSTAYTLSYSVAPTGLADGQTHLVQFNAINGAAPTLNVNALGAKPLHFWAAGGWGAWPANMVAVDQVVRVTYNAAAGTYRAIGMQAAVLNQSVSGASSIDFTGIPATAQNLEITFDLTHATDGTTLQLQFYNSGGSLDAGASSYFYSALVFNTVNASSPSVSSTTTSFMLLTAAVSNSAAIGVSGRISINNIQGVKNTQCTYQTTYLNQGAVTGGGLTGYGNRNANGPITGIRLIASSGNITGKATVTMK